MNRIIKILALIAVLIFATSCASKKKLQNITYELENLENKYRATDHNLQECKKEKSELNSTINERTAALDNMRTSRDESIATLKAQIEDLKKQREQQYSQVGDLTVLSKSASENMNQTIRQLESKDNYIKYLMNAKSKSDSLNLALAVNLKSVLKNGIEDEDVEVRVDKTVVFINLSDKMLFQSGSSKLTARSGEVLSKIAQIVQAHPDLELMVEGYTDNVPIRNSCIEDNWDLSVARSSSVVKTLQKNYNINPNRLIAAGRGEYNTLADNTTSEGRALNRRTRIILMPKLNQFYDLLKPINMTVGGK